MGMGLEMGLGCPHQSLTSRAIPVRTQPSSSSLELPARTALPFHPRSSEPGEEGEGEGGFALHLKYIENPKESSTPGTLNASLSFPIAASLASRDK